MAGKRDDLLNMLCDLSDLSALVTGSENIENFFQRTVTLVSGNLGTPVCSIYLYDETTDELVLKATVGAQPQGRGTGAHDHQSGVGGFGNGLRATAVRRPRRPKSAIQVFPRNR